MDQKKEKKKKALVIEMVKKNVKSFLEETQHVYPEWEFILTELLTPPKTYMDAYNECLDIIKEQNIDAVIATCDRAAYIQGALSKMYPNLKGPTFESFHLTADKILSRKLIVPDEYNLEYHGLRYKDIADSVLPMELKGEMKQPFIAKPSAGTGSTSITKINTTQELLHLGSDEAYGKSIHGMLRSAKDILCKYLDLTKYPDSIEPSLIIEAYVDIGSEASIHSIDCIVAGGKFIPWAISDNLYWEHAPEAFLGMALPSLLPPDVQNKANKIAQDVIEKLLPYGFDDQFIDLEMFLFKDGSIKIMEINGRSFDMMKGLYQKVLVGGNYFKALLDISQGAPIKTPTQKPHTYGLYAYLSTFAKEGKTTDFVDFEVASEYNAEIRGKPDQGVVQAGSSGYTFGYITLVGTSLENCLGKMNSIKHKLLKSPESSPWFYKEHCEHNNNEIKLKT